MTDDLVEIAARALLRSVNGEDVWDAIPRSMQDVYKPHLRAVLAAVEPRIRAAALEEAAKVADHHAKAYESSREEVVIMMVSHDIRALAKQEAGDD